MAEPCRFCKGARISILVLLLWLLVIVLAFADPAPGLDARFSLQPETRTLKAEGVLTGSAATPDRLRLPEGAKDVAITRDKNGALRFSYALDLAPFDSADVRRGPLALAGPEGAFLSEGSGWLPTLNGEALSYRLVLDVPEAYRIITPGRIEAETVTEGRYRITLSSETPLAALPLMAGRWTVSESRSPARNVLIRTYFPATLQGEAADYLARSAAYVDRYAEAIGDYPFSAFHVVAGPLPVGWGYPNLTYIGETVLRLPFIRATSLGHEVLHNWWGNGVYVAHENGNWAEGLTTYLADYAFAKDQGAEEARDMRLGWLSDYAALPAGRDQSLRAFRTKTHGASQVIGYNKAAFVFHMLEADIGEPAFALGLQAFWRDFRFRRASWDDLRTVFETASGRDLGRFFAQWLDRAGAPALGLADVVRHGNVLTFTVTQAEPAYDLHLKVRVETMAGLETRMLRIGGKATPVRMDSAGEVLAFALDPDADLFRRLATEETPPTLRDYQLARQPGLVVLGEDAAFRAAALSLAKTLSDVEPVALDETAVRSFADALLVVGRGDALAAWLAGSGQSPRPQILQGRGTARAWAARGANGAPLLLVEADDAESLAATTRALAHYGRRGYVVFDGGRVTLKGGWPPQPGPLGVDFRKSGATQ